MNPMDPTQPMELRPHHFPRRILLAVTGLSPQVITETLYALATREAPFVPHEIHVISTEKGAERVRLTLLSDEPGWFHRLCREYELPPIRFGEEQIHLLRGATGRVLEDIRTPEEQRAAADFITEQVQRLTADDHSALHVSIAGGRKSMGFFVGYALSLYGRPQDRLSHVLVSEPYESCWEFFYPTRKRQVIFARDDAPIDTRKGKVTLAEIPFVPLRQGMGRPLLERRVSYSQAVAAASKVFEPARVEIDLGRRCLRCGGEPVDLPPARLAIYCWFAAKRRNGESVDAGAPRNAAELLSWYRRLHGEYGADYERMEKALRHGMDGAYLRPHLSKIKGTLSEALGDLVAEKYQIRSEGGRLHKSYGLFGLAPEQIEIG